MLDEHHYSSKMISKIAKFSAILLAGSLLASCSQTLDHNSKTQSIAGLEIDNHEKTVTDIDPITHEDNQVISRAEHNEKKRALPGVGSTPGDAWCRYIIYNSASEASIIASPTVSASTDKDGNNSANIGMNLLDFKKADLIKQSAAAKCRQHRAAKTIEAALSLVGESTKLAAYGAKYNYLQNKESVLSAIVSKARNYVSRGVLTRQEANTVAARVALLRSSKGEALSEVEKRKDLPSLDGIGLAGKNFELANTEAKLQDIDRDIRTLDAFNVSVEAGYNDVADDLQQSGNDDFYGKLKVGVRLGALSPNRRYYEDAARDARLDALHEKNSGVIWKTDFAEKAMAKSLKGLRKAESEYRIQRNKADDTYSRLHNSERSEFITTALLAKVQSISASSDISAMVASISEIKKNQSRLKLLQK